jgi:glycerophosphoryl diester phosphodiesterase
VGSYAISARTVITSFDPLALAIVQRLAPDQQRAFIAKYSDRRDVDTALGLDCVQAAIPLKTGSRARVEAAHAEALIVAGWQGNTPEDLDRLLDWGADVICTDYPSLALRVLQDKVAVRDVGR